LTNTAETEEITNRLMTVYRLQVPREVIASTLTGRPKLPVMLSRALFRPDLDVRTSQRTRTQRERRNFLRGVLGLTVVSLSVLVLPRIASVFSPQPEASSTTPNNPSSSSYPNIPGNPSAPTSRVIANAANIPVDSSANYNDPSSGPIVLIHLDNGQFVAYSSICTHAGCQVQFNPSGKDIVCPCHGAVYDPYNNARVVGGPAPYPLQKIPIQYDSSTGNIYLTG
jgi:thiosulfate dehydrogenase [quinone] large subunit